MKILIYTFILLLLTTSCSQMLEFEVENYNPPVDRSIPLKGNILLVNNLDTSTVKTRYRYKGPGIWFHVNIKGELASNQDTFVTKCVISDPIKQSTILMDELFNTLSVSSAYDTIFSIPYYEKLTAHKADSLCKTYNAATLLCLSDLESTLDYAFFKKCTEDYATSWIAYYKIENKRYPYHTRYQELASQTYPSDSKDHTKNPSRKHYTQRIPRPCPKPDYEIRRVLHTIRNTYSSTDIKHTAHIRWNIYDAKKGKFVHTIEERRNPKQSIRHPLVERYERLPVHVYDSKRLDSLLELSSREMCYELNASIYKQLAYTWVKEKRAMYIKGSTDFEIAELNLWFDDWEGMRKIWEPLLDCGDPKLENRAHYNMALYYEMQGEVEQALKMAEICAQKYGNQRGFFYAEQIRQRILN